MARKYNSIWKQLLKSKHCAIAAHPALHPRIIKAVSCEKNRDIGTKLLMAEVGKKYLLTHKVDGSRIRFFITEFYISGIPLEDL